jgi:hypothetical protein
MTKKECPDDQLSEGADESVQESTLEELAEQRSTTSDEILKIHFQRIYEFLFEALNANMLERRRQLHHARTDRDKEYINTRFDRNRREIAVMSLSEMFTFGADKVTLKDLENVLRIWLGVPLPNPKKRDNSNELAHTQIANWARSILTLMSEGRPIINLVQTIDGKITSMWNPANLNRDQMERAAAYGAPEAHQTDQTASNEADRQDGDDNPHMAYTYDLIKRSGRN